MGYYSQFQYGSGVLYGMQPEFTSVDPQTGPSPGGNKFVIKGNGLNPLQWNDDFTSALLDASKWTDVSSGGSVSTGDNRLQLSTSAVAGSSAGVQSIAHWYSCASEIRVNIVPGVTKPLSDVLVMRYSLWVSGTTYCALYLTKTSLGTLILTADVYVSGAKVAEMRSAHSWTDGVSTFGILRHNSDVYFLANGSLIWNTVNFVSGEAYFRIESLNQSEDYDVDVLRVESFRYKPFAVFQNQPSLDCVVVSDFRMRGTVPPSKNGRGEDAAYQGPVDVTLVTGETLTIPDAYEYYFVNGLKAINDTQFQVEMSVVNDPQLVTPEGASKGLGGGY